MTIDNAIVIFVSLEPLFRPRTVAVVGASTARDKAGNAMMRSLSGFPGELYPVNPRADVIEGRPAYPSLGAIPGPVDLAVLVVPPPAVPGVLAEAADAGVRAAVVCAGGFAESGADGMALQRRVAAIARTRGIRVLGPNTSGFMHPEAGVLANFLPAVTRLRPGPVAFVAQSGSVNLALSFLADAEGLGLRLGVGLGNAADVSFADVLDYLAGDGGTRAVGLHVEGVSDGRALSGAVRRLAERKPVVALKIGRSDVGEFARSHTGALTGDYELTRAALRQAGAVVVDDLAELVDAVGALARTRLPARRRPGVGIVTGQAGPGLIVADTLRSAGVSVPDLDTATLERLSGLLPPLTYQRNPVDTGRPEQTFPDVLATVAADPAVDLLLVYALEEPDAVDPAAALRAAGAAVSTMPTVFGGGGPRDVLDARRAELGSLGVPAFPAPDRAARAVRALVADAAARHRLAHAGDVRMPPPRALPPGPIDEDAAKALLADAELRGPERRACDGRAAAHAALDLLGGPVVVKVLDPDVLHKSDVGGVHVGVRTPSELDHALDAIDAIATGRHARYLVERQAPPGPELIVGGMRDPAFGPVVLLGVGGVGVEVAAEVAGRTALRLAPLSRGDAEEMAAALPGALLRGYRGQVPVDTAAVAAALLSVSEVLVAHADIAELDVNPLRLTADGPQVLDALVLVAPEGRRGQGAEPNPPANPGGDAGGHADGYTGGYTDGYTDGQAGGHARTRGAR